MQVGVHYMYHTVPPPLKCAQELVPLLIQKVQANLRQLINLLCQHLPQSVATVMHMDGMLLQLKHCTNCQHESPDHMQPRATPVRSSSAAGSNKERSSCKLSSQQAAVLLLGVNQSRIALPSSATCCLHI